MTNAIAAIGLFLASIFFSTVCDCLRNFLRSRLAAVCRVRRNEERFGQILRDDEIALQACELAFLTTLVSSIVLWSFVHYTSPGPPISTGHIWFDLIASVTVVWLSVRVFPWTMSRVAAEYVLFSCWPIIRLVTSALRPCINIAYRFDTLMHRIAGRRDPMPENLETFAEEIQSVVDEGEREGILESRAGKMIARIMELRQDDVRTVMTPRTDIVAIQVDCTLAEARQHLLDAGHSRVPVIEGSPDHVVGILYARDLLESLGNEHERTLRDIVRDPFYVPETTSIDDLLERMKRERTHLAIVLDEYGGVTGLVTLEDILEEIVGDIADEFDEREEELYELVNPQTLRVDARMHLDELNDLFDLNLPEDRDFDTIGGLVFSELGRVPKNGESIQFDPLTISVVEATDRKVLRLELVHVVPWEMPQQLSSTNGLNGNGNSLHPGNGMTPNPS